MSNRCPICAGVVNTETATCTSCGHELVEHEVPVRVPDDQHGDNLTTESLLAAPAIYRKLLDEDPLSPLWSENSDPLTLPLPDRQRPRDRWTPAIVAVVIAVIAVFGLTRLFGGGDSEADNPAAETEVLGEALTGPINTVTPSTTTPSTTTTAAPTTTTTAPSTTTTVAELSISPVGDPIPLSELALGAFALEPFEFGTPFGEVLGRFAASFDEPSEISEIGISNGELGTCNGNLIQTVRWGRLLVIGMGNGSGELVFAGYRIDSRYDSFRYPAVRTISGLGVGDSIADLESTYTRVRYISDGAEGLVFQVFGGDGSLLIWGPVTSSEAGGEVLGIYSPDSCGTL